MLFSTSAPAGTIVDGTGYASSGTTPLGITPIGHSADTDTGVPKAYLNYIFINKNFDIASVRTIYRRISSAAREDGSDVPHEKLSFEDPITEEGYVYVYVSNDGGAKDVYFDDFKITHEKLPIIQSQDYYPFGLSFNSYQREDGLTNPFQYNGKEMQDEGGLGWLDYGARMYMPEIGRWGVVDPLAEKDRRWSVYRYGYDNPNRFIDPDGMFEYSNGYTTTDTRTDAGSIEHWQMSGEQWEQNAGERQASVNAARGVDPPADCKCSYVNAAGARVTNGDPSKPDQSQLTGSSTWTNILSYIPHIPDIDFDFDVGIGPALGVELFGQKVEANLATFSVFSGKLSYSNGGFKFAKSTIFQEGKVTQGIAIPFLGFQREQVVGSPEKEKFSNTLGIRTEEYDRNWKSIGQKLSYGWGASAFFTLKFEISIK